MIKVFSDKQIAFYVKSFSLVGVKKVFVINWVIIFECLRIFFKLSYINNLLEYYKFSWLLNGVSIVENLDIFKSQFLNTLKDN